MGSTASATASAALALLALTGYVQGQQGPWGATCPMQPTVTPDPGTVSHVWAGWLHDPFSLDGEVLWIGEDGGRIRRYDAATGSHVFGEVPKDVRGAVRRVQFLPNGLTGYAISTDGFVLKTDDGGLQWKALARVPPVLPASFQEDGRDWEPLYDIHMHENGLDGWMAAEHGILYTTDGGVCWQVAELYQGGQLIHPGTIVHTWAFFYGLDVRWEGGTTDFLGLAVGRPGMILRSTDLGRTWDVVFSADVDLCPLIQGTCLADACNGSGISPWFELWDVEIGDDPADPLALVACSITNLCGMMLSSSDDGLTWVRELHECEHPAGGVNCDCTTNCDSNYDETLPPHRLDEYRGLYGVAIFPDNTAVVAGYNGQHLRREELTDGTQVVIGALWRDRSEFGPWPLAPTTVTIFPLYGAMVPELPTSPGRAYLTGPGGALRVTHDGGEMWEHALELEGQPYRTTVVWFKPHPTLDRDIGWQAGQFFRLADSDDSGVSWEQSTPERTYPHGAQLLDMEFAGDGEHGVSVGSSIPGSTNQDPHEGPRIVWTDDFGDEGWELPDSISYLGSSEQEVHLLTDLRAVCWAKDGLSQQFWSVGGKGLVLRSTNGGRDWTQIQIALASVPDPHQLDLRGVAASGPTAIVAVGRLGGVARAYGWSAGTWTQIPVQTSVPGTVRMLSAVTATGATMYAVGHRERPDGSTTGAIFKYDPSVQPSGAFIDFAGPLGNDEVADCLDAGDGGIAGQVLTAVEVLPNGDLWIGATCGRVWQRVASTHTWVEHKTQTDADIRKMMFLSPTRGYFAALGGEGTNQVLVRYQAQ